MYFGSDNQSRWARLGQRIVIPIALSPNPDVDLALALLAVPALSAALLHYAFLLPRKRRKVQKRLRELSEENAELFEGRRKEAEGIRLMLEEQVARKVAVEEAKQGLVITAARYGPKDDSSTSLDVRVALQALVANSQLLIPSGRSKSGLLGFYDLSPGQAKSLQLEYTFGNRSHRVDYDDFAAVTLPLRLHVVE